MNVRKMTKDELELLSFTDMAYNLIKLDKKTKTTVDLFKEICSLLELSKKEYEDKIADFFTSLTIDKRFILLDSVNWDLKENHSVSTIIDDSEDDFEEEVDEDMDELDGEDNSEIEEESLEDDLDSELSDIDDEELEGLDELEDIDELEEESEEIEESNDREE
jgi:DNA-directed RNA polymerase subunit delta